MQRLNPPVLEEIQAARSRLGRIALRTPLVRFGGEGTPAEIYLKLENLQPTGSFKLRGAANALLQLDPEALAGGVWTASAGNMGLGLAWSARRLGIPCTVILPHDAPAAKRAALARLGALTVGVPFDQYQAIQRQPEAAGMAGRLVHPFADRAVMAGNGVIALETLEDLPEVESILIPYGGGGLSCGIAAAVRAVKPGVKVYAVEVETGAPLAASLAAGRAVETPYTPSFISGMGAPFVFPRMWPLARRLLDGALVVRLDQVAAALRSLAEANHVIAEGAGAVALAAALTGQAGRGKIACIVSGGNIDRQPFLEILTGAAPAPSGPGFSAQDRHTSG